MGDVVYLRIAEEENGFGRVGAGFLEVINVQGRADEIYTVLAITSRHLQS